ncbi:MAG: IS30 family transposase [Actinobacteria bacterium]|nr:IS30 family transposase [Actinomycetota bacterium]
MGCYAQLTPDERYQIRGLLKAGYSLSELAMEMGRHKSTISREIGRNSGQRGYRPAQAQRLADTRRREAVTRRITDEHWQIVERFIRFDLSPEQASGRLCREQGIKISPEWIYQYIYADKAAGGDLHTHLRGQKPYRKRYGGGRERRGQLKDRVSIDKRPAVVERRSRLGDWEGDTIIGGNRKGALVSLVERKSSFTLIGKLAGKTAAETRDAATGLLEPIKEMVHTITLDNGKEFACHGDIAKSLKADICFAHPYSSWERGLNENTNGLIRQYFPKKHDFTTITLTKRSPRLRTGSITAPGKSFDSKPRMK